MKSGVITEAMGKNGFLRMFKFNEKEGLFQDMNRPRMELPWKSGLCTSSPQGTCVGQTRQCAAETPATHTSFSPQVPIQGLVASYEEMAAPSLSIT